jgi:DNA-binding GntR family transcriptional regulator
VPKSARPASNGNTDRVGAIYRALRHAIIEQALSPGAKLPGRLTADQIKRLESHVDDEERARGANEPLSIRLATEFHIVLAEMTGSPVLTRYVSEVASRCGLILALYSRPHSAECAVSEHRAIIAALAAGDADRATAVMDQHLEAVAGRALIVSRPPRDYDIKTILARYADDAPARLRRQARARVKR